MRFAAARRQVALAVRQFKRGVLRFLRIAGSRCIRARFDYRACALCFDPYDFLDSRYERNGPVIDNVLEYTSRGHGGHRSFRANRMIRRKERLK